MAVATRRPLAKLRLLVGLFSVAMTTLVYLPTPTVHAAAGINPAINFQGKLTNPNGTNIANGSYAFVFSLYSAASGGSALWTESDSLTLTDGIFQVNLGPSATGANTNFANVDFNSDSLYLGIKVGTDPEMTPRVRFTATPYAFNADKLDGIDSSGFAQLNPSSAQSGSLNVTGTVQAATSLQAPVVDTASSVALAVGGTNATSVTVGRATSTTATTIQGSASSTFTATSASGTTTVGFRSPTTARAIFFPNAGGDICTTVASTCNGTYQAAGSYLAKDSTDTSTASISAASYLYQFSNSNVTPTTGGVLSLSNGANTGDTLLVTASGNPSTSTKALLVVNNTAGSPSGNLLDLQVGGTNKFSVDTNGAALAVSLDSTTATSLDIGTNNATSIGLKKDTNVTGALTVTTTLTNTSGNGNAETITATANPASAPAAATNYIATNQAITASGSNINGNVNLYGFLGQVGNGSTNTLGSATGASGLVFSANNITTANGLSAGIVNSGTGTFGTANELLAQSPTFTSTGAITTAYGLNIQAQKVAGVTTGYGINQAGANDLNSFAGVTTFSATGTALTVTNNAKVGTLTVDSGETITAGGLTVTAGGVTVNGGNINAAAGTIQTNGTTRIDNAGNFNGGTVTGTGNFNSSGGAIQTNGTTRIDNAGNYTGGTINGLTISSVAVDSASVNGALAIGGTKAITTVGRVAAKLTLQGLDTSILKVADSGGTNFTTVGFTTPTHAANSISFPDASGTLCTDVAATCSATYATASPSAGGYLQRNATDTSTANVTATNFLYTFTNGSSAVASGVLKVDNGTNTGSAISVTSAGNAASGQALILANNTNGTPSGKLLDLQTGGVSKFSVDTSGNQTNAGTINLQTISATAQFTGTVTVASGETITTGGLTISAGGETITSGNLAVNSGTITSSGNINSSGGTIQTNGTTRIDNAGNFNGGTVTGSGNINSTGGSLQTNSTTRIDNAGNFTGGTVNGLTISSTSVDSATSGNALAIGGTNGVTTVGRTGALLTLQGLDTSLIKINNAANTKTTTLAFTTPTNNQTITFPDAGGFVCTTVAATCNTTYQAAGSYLLQNPAANDTSTSNFAGSQYTFTQSNTGAAGNLQLNNAGTASSLAITQTGTSEPSAGNALLLINNNTTTPSGNLVDLQNKGTSKLSVDTAGNETIAGTINLQTISSAAQFTGTLTVATGETITAGGLTVTAGGETINGGNLSVASGTITASSNINSSGGAIQTNGTTRIDNAGNFNGGTVTGTGNFNSSGGSIQTNGTTRIDNAGNFTGGTVNGLTISSSSVDAASSGGALAIGGINGVTTVGRTGALLTLQGNGSSVIQANNGTNFTKLQFSAISAQTTLSIPNVGTTLCTDTASTCSGTYQVAGSYLLQNPASNDLSTSNFAGSQYTFTQNNTGAAGNLQLNNAGTGSSLSITQTGTSEPSSGNALLLINNNTTTPAGNLVDLQNKGTSKLSVDTAGNETIAGTINSQTITSAAQFTGTVTVATGETITAGGLTVTNGGETINGGNFLQNSAGTFGTGTGNVSLNGDTAVTAGKNFTVGTVFTVNSTTGNVVSNIGSVTVNGISNPSGVTLTGSPSGGTLAASTTFAYRIAAINANGVSTTAVVPTPASYTSGGGPNNNQTTLSWTAVTGAANYKIYRTINGGTNWFVNTVAGGTTSANDNGTNFTWATAGTPPDFSSAGGVNLTGGGGVTYNGVNGGAVTIQPSNSAITNYTLQLPTGQGGANTVLLNDGSGNLSWTGTAGCSTCVATVPSSTGQNTVQPANNGVVSLTLQGTSGTGTPDILDIRNSGGGTLYAGFSSSGLLTLNSGETIATGKTFTNASSSLFTAVLVADVSGGGSIGSNTTTVDVATTFNVSQATPNMTLSLPSPTVTTPGRVVYVSNTGSVSFLMSGVTVSPNNTAIFQWNGSQWTSAGIDGSGANYIQNQNSANQTANFRITGSGQANVSMLSPAFDVASAGVLSLGTSTATSITVGKAAITTNIPGTLSLGTAGTTAGSVQLQTTGSAVTIQAGSTTAATTVSFPTLAGTADTFCLQIKGNCSGVSGEAGFQNYITKFNNAGGTAIAHSQLFDNGTFVGVNTTIDNGLVSIVGPAQATAGAAAKAVLNVSGGTGGTGAAGAAGGAGSGITVQTGLGGNGGTGGVAQAGGVGATGGSLTISSGSGGQGGNGGTGVTAGGNGGNGGTISIQGGSGGNGGTGSGGGAAGTAGSFGSILLQQGGGNVNIGSVTTPAAGYELEAANTVNGISGFAVHNASAGTLASNGYVAYNDNAGFTNNYGYFGVGGTGYTSVALAQNRAFAIAGPGTAGLVVGNVGASNPTIFINNSAEVARFDSTGQLGIGQTTPGAKLDVVGSGKFSTSVIVPLVNTPDSTTANTANLVIRSGNASSGTNLSSGSVTIDSGTRTGTGTGGSILIGTTNSLAVSLGNANATYTLSGGAGVGNSSITASNGGNTTTVTFANPTAARAISFPDAGGTICTTTSSTCSATYQVAGTYLQKNAVDTSAFAVTATNFLYTFSNSNGTPTTGGVLKLDNGANTGNTLSVTTSGNPAAATNALIVANNTNGTPSGNLIDLQTGGTNKFTVDVNGNVVGGTINTATISGGTLSGGTFSGGTVSGGTLTATAVDGLGVGANAIDTVAAGALAIGGTNATTTVGRTGAALTLQGNASTVITATNGANTTSVGFTTPTAARTITFPDASGTVALAPATGNFIKQVPAATSDNVIAPTAASVVGLTLKGTSNATSARVLEFYDSTATPALQGYIDATGSLNVSKLIQPTGNNTIDIGVSGANAFRTGYFGTSLFSPSFTGTGAVTVSSGGAAALTLTSASGDILTASTINGQTISSAANFTGTLQVRGSGGLTVGVAGTTIGNINLATSAANTRMVVIQGLNPSGAGNATVQVPSIAGGSTDTFCLAAANNCGNVTATGTTNYVARFTGTSTLGIGNIYDTGTSGFVGIGTTTNNGFVSLVSPAGAAGGGAGAAGGAAQTALNVNGGTGGIGGTSGNGGAGSAIGLTSGTGGAGGGPTGSTSNGGNGANGGNLTFVAGDGGAGGMAGALAVGGTGGNGGNISLQAGGAGAGGPQFTGGLGTAGVAGNAGVITLQATGGNVGIGLSAPTRVLDVAQNVNNAATIGITNANTGGNAFAGFQAANSGAGLASFGLGGTGYTVVPFFQNRAFIAANASTSGIGIATTSAQPVIFGVNASEVARFDTTGNFGIGDASPAALLTVGSGDLFQVNSSGNVTTQTSITFAGASGLLNTADSTAATTKSLTIRSGNASTGTNLGSGDVTIDSGTKTGTGSAGTVNLGTTNAPVVNVGNTGSTLTLNGSTSTTLTATSSTNFTKLQFASISAQTTLSIPNTGTKICTDTASTCSATYQTAGSYLLQNPASNDASASNFAGYQYSFTQSNTGAAGNLQLTNAGTNSALSITQSGNPSSGQALILANNTNGTPSGNLIDLQKGGVSQLAVDTGGNITQIGGSATTDLINGQRLSAAANFSGTITSASSITISSNGLSVTGGINNNNGGITNTGAVAGATTIALNSTISGGTIYSASSEVTAPVLSSADSTSANTAAVSFRSGNASTGANLSSGNVTLDSGTFTGTGTGGSVAIGGTNASSTTVGRTGAALTLQGNASTVLTATSGANTTTVSFTAPSAARSIVFPDAGGTVCTTTATTCSSTYQAAGSYLAKGAADTSSASITASNFLYGFTNSNSAATGGVLQLTNAGTGNTLQVVASSNPNSTNNALIFANNTNAGPAGNLLLLQNSGTSKFSVDVNGAATVASTINLQTISAAANFTGTVAIATSVSSPIFTSADTNTASTNSAAVNFRSGNASGTTSNSGNVTIDSGTATGTTGSVSIGTANASSVTIGQAANGKTLLMQGGNASTLKIEDSTNSFTTTVGFNNPTANVIYKFDTASAGTYNVCTTSQLASTCATAGSGFVQFSPSSAQTDSTANASIFINKTGSGNILRLQASGTDSFVVQNNGVTTIAGSVVTVTPSTFKVKIGTGTPTLGNGSTGALFVTDSSEFLGQILVGTSTNGVGIDATNHQVTYSGTARHLKHVTLVPEFPGAVLTGSGSANIGTMTSDFCSGTSHLNIPTGGGPCAATDDHNYYTWTTNQGSAQTYDIYVRYTLPSDYSQTTSTSLSLQNLTLNGWRSTSGDAVSYTLYNGSTVCGTTGAALTTTTTWSAIADSTPTSDTGCQGLTAGTTVTFKIHVQATNTNFARAGELNFDYQSTF